MRVLLLALAALALSACVRGQQAAGCDMSVSREIAFTGGEAADVVTARAVGPTCDKASGFYAIHDGEGHPIWAWAAPLPRAFGEIGPPEEPAHMREFLARWAEPRIATTNAAPAWNTLEAGQTTLDQLTYDDIRARNLPMLCHYSGTAQETCVFWEPAAGGAGHFLDRSVEETDS